MRPKSASEESKENDRRKKLKGILRKNMHLKPFHLKKYNVSTEKQRLWKIWWSTDLLEVLSNFRVVGETYFTYVPSLIVFLVETMRAAIHSHNWLTVSKCVEGLAEKFKIERKQWIVWNGGFLALANKFPNDLDKMTEFTLHGRNMLRCYPKRLGIEMATYFTQKGYFLRGLKLMNDLETVPEGKRPNVFLRDDFKLNPKRYQVDLISTLLNATKKYSCWKRDMARIQDDLFPEDMHVQHIHATGQAALYEYKKVLALAEKADADVTLFIEPMIELVMQFEDEFAARALFLKLVENHPRNFILEGLYLKFIENYFSFLEEEVEHFFQSRKIYNFVQNDHQLDVFKLRNWKNNILQKKQKGMGFEVQLLPNYSI